MVDQEVLVKVENLSKKFCKDLKTSLWYGVKDLSSNFLGNRQERQLRDKEFWALKDINFELRRGECLGLIGHNGAGKSTLLKILNGLIQPDSGKVTIKGKVGALIELGAGFNPILTGRENIYNNGAILGFTRKEINEKLEEIIDFTEIREFIDMPVQHYSSGMKVRLGFAIAAQMEPDVLIIDEVLAVGDLGFVLKCFKTIDDLLPRTAIIFVSHNLPMVSRVCNQIAVLTQGKTLYVGKDVSKGLDLYYNQFSNLSTNIVFSDNTIKLKSFYLEDFENMDEKLGPIEIEWGNDLKVKFNLIFRMRDFHVPLINIIILDKEQRAVARSENSLFVAKNSQEKMCSFSINIPSIQLSKGVYSVDFVALDSFTRAPKLRINGVGSFQIVHELDIWEPFFLKSTINSNGKLQ